MSHIPILDVIPHNWVNFWKSGHGQVACIEGCVKTAFEFAGIYIFEKKNIFWSHWDLAVTHLKNSRNIFNEEAIKFFDLIKFWIVTSIHSPSPQDANLIFLSSYIFFSNCWRGYET